MQHPLSAQAIYNASANRLSFNQIHIHDVLDSSNRYLLDLARQGAPHGTLVVADAQSAGRGRQGRCWHSPAGQNLYLSCLLHFPADFEGLAAFSLVAGAALAACLSEIGLRGHGLKWPNDLLHQQAKLGGILAQRVVLPDAGVGLVVGLGLNVLMRDAVLDQPWTSLVQVAAAQDLLDRNVLAGRIAAAWLSAQERFCQQGLQAFLPLWAYYDVLDGQPVCLHGDPVSYGTACGVTNQGFLRIRCGDTVRELRAGDVKVRLVNG